jgi:hypothetical protein
VVTANALEPLSLVCLLTPAGWTFSAEGKRQVRLLVRIVRVEQPGTRSYRCRGDSFWVTVLSRDAPLIVALLKDLSREFLVPGQES